MQKAHRYKWYTKKKKILSNKVLTEIHVSVDPQVLSKHHFQPWSPKGKFPMEHINFLFIVKKMEERVLVVSHGKRRHFFAALIKWILVSPGTWYF